ncbi:MAG: prolyl-tRNA synthetase associated domain-containing protein [Lachnospiraceae bacterium]|nr:prolyl-tRNA synthetase associated domain-containing protein [Lachnospiraceae bacterium]
MEIFHGRPEDASGRLAKEIAVYDLLEKLEIQYDRVDHGPMMSIAQCEEVDQTLKIEICKNLFLCNQQKTKFYLLMMPGTKKFVTREVCRLIPSPRLSFANEKYMEEFLNITPGSVSVMGLMNDTENHVQLLIDREVAESEYFGCHPCMNTSSLKMRTKDMLEKFLPYVHHDYQVLDIPDAGMKA